MKRTLLVAGVLTCFYLNAQLVYPDQFALAKIADRVRAAFTSGYWQQWSTTPFTILLIDEEREYLLYAEPDDTTFRQGKDDIPYRRAAFNKHFLATFPLINQQPTIVVGTPKNTSKSPEAWVITLLHEHFHQLQFSHPRYYSDQNALGLAKGDETGMWMLNHPFPYNQHEVAGLIKRMSANLLRIYEVSPKYRDVLNDHLYLKNELKKLVGQEHYAYLNLQLWQEGFARFVEIKLLEDWINNFEQVHQQTFTKAELDVLLAEYHSRIKRDLTEGDLATMRRVYFYSLGAAEAMLISGINPDWKERYFEKLYTTDHLLVSP